ncbi:MAG: hypothetical protein DRI84_02190 [Bacteroidetes bacterium]|nr:MAG: hypothetical protein DRI84_02190 [Bacteroidota bacterium]
MKILGFILLFLFGIFFSTPFKVVKVTKQEQMGGRMESGTSTVYLFKIVAKKPSTKLHYEDLWIGTEYYAIEASHQKPDNSITNEFEKGDTIFFQAVRRFLPDDRGDLVLQKSSQIKNVPLEYAGKALIGYKYKEKQHYYAVEDIEVLTDVNLP